MASQNVPPEHDSAPPAERAFRLDGKVALITGASSGLGERFARVLASAGARVGLVARRADRLERLSAELPGSIPIACDLGESAQLEVPVARTIEACGRIDVLVNNAGIERSRPALDETEEVFREVLGVNLVAPFVLACAAARDMLSRGEGGSIINIASIIGLIGVGRPPQAAYAASKGGLVNLTRELSAQWSPSGIRVNAIAPGFFASQMTEQLFAEESGYKWVARHTAMRRHGDPHELDGALLYLASDASTYTTGTILPVDGGWTSI
jgi:NAD(P)-dependent dehydrogenase (short-subunit alcohol dehydrogenase family)